MKNLISVLFLTFLGSGAFAQDNQSVAEGGESSPRISRGGLMVEPILSVSREQSTIKTSQLPIITDDTSGSMEGFGAGLRLGLHASEVIFLGVDGRYGHMKFNDSFYKSAEGDMYNVGPSVLVQMPVFGLRAWGTYVMAGQFNPGAGIQGLDVKFTDAKGYRLGVGVRVAAMSVNLEYQNLKFDKTEIESWGSVAVNNSANVDFDDQGYSLSLSFPLEF